MTQVCACHCERGAAERGNLNLLEVLKIQVLSVKIKFAFVSMRLSLFVDKLVIFG